MRIPSFLLLIVLCLALPFSGNTQTVVGVVTDIATGGPMAMVYYENIFTHENGMTDSTGRISIPATGGQMVEFHKMGYNTARLRVPHTLPPYFKIRMEQGAIQLDEVKTMAGREDFRRDSIRNRRFYQNAIEYQKLSGVQMIQHPFTAMSHHYQSIMRFQKEYAYLEEQRYIDYNFNPKTITSLTGLTGDSLQKYMRQYRPTYDQLRKMPEYTFFSYIKNTADLWRRKQQPSSDRTSGY